MSKINERDLLYRFSNFVNNTELKESTEKITDASIKRFFKKGLNE